MSYDGAGTSSSVSSYATLVCDAAEGDDIYAVIEVNKKKFTIGRSTSNDFTIPKCTVSLQHCTLEFNKSWTISDHSLTGTKVNGFYVKKGEKVELKVNDKITFGGKTYRFISWSRDDPPHKKRKLQTNNDDKEYAVSTPAAVCPSSRTKGSASFVEIKLPPFKSDKCPVYRMFSRSLPLMRKVMHEEVDRLEAEHDTELQAHVLKQRKLKKENEALLEKENKLSSKLREMEQKLTEQESVHGDITQKLIDKEKQEIEELKTKLREKENRLRTTLQVNMNLLQTERKILEESMQLELKKDDKSGENLRKLKEKMNHIQKELESVEGKKMLLETELQNVNSTNKDVSLENELRATEDILSNFGSLMESELQCSICNELFVTATTLNCTHTFCQYCIGEWKKKSKKCPVCRGRITSENRSIAFDSFINSMVANLTPDLKRRRDRIIEDRSASIRGGPSSSTKTKAVLK